VNCVRDHARVCASTTEVGCAAGSPKARPQRLLVNPGPQPAHMPLVLTKVAAVFALHAATSMDVSCATQAEGGHVALICTIVGSSTWVTLQLGTIATWLRQRQIATMSSGPSVTMAASNVAAQLGWAATTGW